MMKSNLQASPKLKQSVELEAEKQAEKQIANFLGTLSAKYESGKSGAGTVSSGVGDRGGISYGLYQMSSQPNGGTVIKFISQPNFPWASRLKAYPIGSPEFAAVWREIAEKDARFERAQHQFIRDNHYLPMVKSILNRCAIDLNDCSFALQNVIWSCAVQHGGRSTLPMSCWMNLPIEVQNSDPLSRDTAWITAIYTERGRVNDKGILVHFPSCSPEVQKSLKARFKSESLAALNMLTNSSKSISPSLAMAKMPLARKG
ncbi:MAG: hypothetical protein QM523_01510 [Candidatus Pacebacteria bacterium]|nr:hypothetical protein [Candidatus Paceibacterota bacterium]